MVRLKDIASINISGNSATSDALNTSSGSATQPIYFSNGKPTECTYTLAKSVPSDAVFTDTVYTLPNATSSTLGGVKIGSNITVSSGTISLTKANVTAALGYTPPTSDTNTTYSAGTGLSLSGTSFSVNYGTSAGTACQGNDSRLSNSRPASDVYSWAKASTKPSYSWSEITGKPSTFTPSSHSHNYLPSEEVSVEQNTDAYTWIRGYALTDGKLRSHVYNTNGTEWSYWIGMSTSKAYGSIIRTSYNAGTPTIQVMGLYNRTWSNWRTCSFEGHTHSYAGSSSAGGSATSAVKLDTATAGSSTLPCYFTGGKPASCGTSLAVSITGSSATATTSYAVYDYNATTTPIKIGYSGTGLTASTASHIAAYGTSGSTRVIKDMSWTEVVNKLVSSGIYTARDRGVNSVSTLASLPVTKSTVIASLSAATTISLAANMNIGESITVICTPSASFTQPIPTSGSFISMDGSSLSVTSGKKFEINILCYNTNVYSISCKTAS